MMYSTKANRSVKRMILITPELDGQLNQLSAQKDASKNEIINRACSEYVKRYLKLESASIYGKAVTED